MTKGKKALAVLLSAVMAWGSISPAYGIATWQYKDGNWYYRNGEIQKTGWISEGEDIWYYLNSAGVMQTGWQETANNEWFYLNEAHEGIEGQMRYGWYQDTDGSWYYLSTEHDGSFGKMVTGWAWIDGLCYYFGSDGRMYKNGQTPDGYTVDDNGHWTVDGVVQAEMGKGYESRHSHSNSSTVYEGKSKSKNSGSSSVNSGSDTSESNTQKGVYEKSATQTYESTKVVKTFDTTSEKGSAELELFYDTILASWISDLPEADEAEFVEGNAREIELAVSNENPFLKYIENGKIEEGDVIYIPASSNAILPLALVYIGHDDSFSGNKVLDIACK